MNMSDSKDTLLKILKLNFCNDPFEINLRDHSRDSWKKIYVISCTEKVAPLLFFTLKKFDLQHNVPDKVLTKLQRSYLATMLRNNLLLKEVGFLLERLRDKALQNIIIKGLALDFAVYPEMGLRPMSDIDVVCRKKDVNEIEKILYDLGFKKINRPASDEKLSRLLHIGNDYVRPRPFPLRIDLHHDLNYLGYQLDKYGQTNFQRVWDNAKKIKPKDLRGRLVEVQVMSAEDSILNLSGHCSIKHKGGRIINYCDVAFLIKKEQRIDWEYITENILGSPFGKAIYIYLRRCKELTGADIPDKHLNNLRNGCEKSPIFIETLVSTDNTMLVNLLSKIRIEKKWWKKAGLFFYFVFPSGSYLRKTYKTENEFMLYVFYLLRPFLLLSKLVHRGINANILYLERIKRSIKKVT